MMLIYKKHDKKQEIADAENKSNELAKPEILENTMRFDEPINDTTNVLSKNNRHMVANKNKKTKEEIKEANRIYKQKQREKMKEKYGDEEYKKIRAKEIADSRAKRKENSV